MYIELYDTNIIIYIAIIVLGGLGLHAMVSLYTHDSKNHSKDNKDKHTK